MILGRIHRRHLIGDSAAAAAVHAKQPTWAPSLWPRAALTRTHLRSRRVLEISGTDAGPFLQGLISNDVRRDNRLLYTGFFTHKGRYLFDAFLWRHGPEGPYRLDIAESALDTALAHIRRYRLRSKINIEDISDHVRIENITCPDPTLFQQLQRDLPPDAQADFDPRCSSLGVRCALSSDHTQQLDSFVSIAETDLLYDACLIMQGVPRHGLELIPDKTIPLEANLDLLNAIAFTKGCYLGQELIARSHFTGVVRKRIVPFLLSKRQDHDVDQPLFPTAALDPEWDSSAIQPGASITCGPKDVGKVLSNVGNIGMALLRLDPLFRPSSAFRCEPFQLHPIVPAYWTQRPTS